jgi:trk system potassium uptake protein TrkH
MTVALIGFGALFLAADENLLGSMLAGMPVGRQAAVTIFTVVSARTAGLTIVPLARLTESSQLLLMISMFIGGGPASMAGGVSTSTVAVIAVAVAASIQGETEANAFKRTIPTETVYKAISVMTISTLLVALSTLVLVDMGTGRVFPVAFETVSAFSNTGYSLGTTADLSGLGRVLIGLVMFWGRLGPLTIVVALAQRSQPTMVGYPEEPVILG